MDIENGNDSGINGSISDESRNSNKSISLKQTDAVHNRSLGRPVGCVHRMSTMPEEEDVSDDTDPDVIKIGHHQHTNRAEIGPEWSSEEKSRLLNSAGSRIVISSAGASNGNTGRTTSRDAESPESIQNDHHRWSPQSRPATDQTESRSSSDHDNGYQSPGRLCVKNVDQPHATRHHHHCHCPSVRAPRVTSVVMDECQQQHCSCCLQSSPPTWASILYEANGNQARSFADTVSIRSLASIGLGSSDGRKLTIRRVPTSPSELLNVVHPPP